MSLVSRIKRAFSAFALYDKQPSDRSANFSVGNSTYSYMRSAFRPSPETFTTKLYNQMAIDVANAKFRHIVVDQNECYVDDYASTFSDCMKYMANIDQTWARFIQDLIWTMFDYGAAAIIAVDTSANPMTTDSYDISSLRVGRVVNWYPRHVKVEVYNDQTGSKQELTIDKGLVGIVQNPLYMVMNQPSSDLKRLLHKLTILDAIDEQSGSGKLDIILQIPYAVDSARKESRAIARRTLLEKQIANSKYGVAYIDSTEKITQLNRPATNNLMDQVTWLTEQVYSSLGLTPEVFQGKASEQQMLVYQSRTINPILNEIATVLSATFLSANARGRGQRIMWFRDPFEVVPMTQMGKLAQEFTSSEVMTANEVRSRIGFRQSKEATADKLSNPYTSTSRPSYGSQPAIPEPTEEE